ncbi:AEC family transporter [Beutenbergia cavernae]|uniref:AEC family transporter n=1 Tax=Beutenbergia cavernae TaxID=84757 RepID=UPI0003166891|nr:AEC family transporter [Beutenbergia cavernae]
MSGVLSGFSLIAAIVAIGYVLGRFRVLGDAAPLVLSRLAFFVATPALLFSTLAASRASEVFSAQSVTGWVSASAMLVVYAVAARWWLRRPGAESVIGALCSGYVNAGNLGIPIAVYALGGAAAVVPAMMFQMVVLAPAAFVVLDVLTGRGDRSGLRSAVVPLLNPMLLAALAGIGVSLARVELPEVVMGPIDMLGATAVPVMLIAFGISLHGAPIPGRTELRRPLVLAVALKNAGQPALAWVLGTFAFGLTGPALLAAVVVAALPTAQNVFTFAMRYGSGVALAREAILVSTIASVPVILAVAAVLT